MPPFTGHLIDFVFFYRLNSSRDLAKMNFGTGKVTVTAHGFSEACSKFAEWNQYEWFKVTEVYTAEQYVSMWGGSLPQNISTIDLYFCVLPSP